MAMMGADQAGLLAGAFDRADWTREQIDQLREGDRLKEYRDVLLGRAKIVTVDHPIDLKTTPGLYSRVFEVVKHRPIEMSTWNASKMKVFGVAQLNAGAKGIKLAALLEAFHAETFYNANMLDFFWVNPMLYPDELRDGRHVYFPDTTYGLLPHDDECIRYLCFDRRQGRMFQHHEYLKQIVDSRAWLACVAP